jgi:DHA3 family macrolide efflux protein-like MFS transporter
MFASPMLAGAVLSVAPIEAILFIDVVTAILGVCIVFFLVKVPARVKCAEAAGAPGDYFHDLKEGIAYIRRHDFIKHFLLFAAVFNIMASPAALLTPLQVTRNFGADVWRLTAIEIAFSLGMLLGGLIMSLWGGFGNRTHSMALATALFGLETIGLGLLGNFWVYLACMGVLGLSMPLFSTPMTAILQSKVDEAYMGRVFSVMMMISSVAMPLSMVVFGPLGDIIAIDFLLIGTGAIIFLLSFTIIGSRSLREAGRSS